MEYRLRDFDPASTKHSRIWLIIGPRGSGKTILLRDILYRTRKQYDIGVAMTATTSTVDTFKDFIPYHLIFKTLSERESWDFFIYGFSKKGIIMNNVSSF